MKYCNKCGNPISSTTKFCTTCGNLINNTEAQKETTFINEEVDAIKEIEDEISSVNTQEDNKIIKKENESKAADYGIDIVKPRKNIFSAVLPKIIIVLIVVIAAIGGVFFKKIEGQYYLIKCNSSNIDYEKLNYSFEAVKLLKNNKSMDAFKNAVENMPSKDISLVEKRLSEIESILTKKDYQTLAISVKNKKIDELYSNKKYDEISKEFEELDKLGGDIRANKNYEDILLNIVSKVTNEKLVSTKNLLMKNENTIFDNLDGDSFDEIVKINTSSYYNTEILLYKLKGGQYKLVDQYVLKQCYDAKVMGAYKYTKDKKGIFINYYNYNNNPATAVIGITNDVLSLKGAISSSNFTKPDDGDNDGIYEILSNNITNIVNQEENQWFKVYDDGSAPSKVTINNSSKSSSTNKDVSSSDYIFKDSDSRVLTDEDLKGLSKEQLALARNEIFARHGYVFKENTFKQYFQNKSWYKPNPSYDGSDSALNQTEIANYKIIQKWEKQ